MEGLGFECFSPRTNTNYQQNYTRSCAEAKESTVTSVRPTCCRYTQWPTTPQEALANSHSTLTWVQTVDFETSALCRHDIISLIPQARIYKALLPHLLNHLMNMTHTHTSRKRGHWPNATETFLISFHEGCFSCQVYSDRIRSTQKVR